MFVSYRHQDPGKTWVRKRLVPALESAGVRVLVDYRDFRLGEPVVREMARAIETSRFTVGVLTPAYLESEFCDLEPVMAEYLGMEEKSRRLMLVMREPCRPRIDLRSRLWLDMTSDEDFEENVAKLVSEVARDSANRA